MAKVAKQAAASRRSAGKIPDKNSDQKLDQTEVARLAYHFFEIEGRLPGRALEHWLRAEAELSAR